MTIFTRCAPTTLPTTNQEWVGQPGKDVNEPFICTLLGIFILGVIFSAVCCMYTYFGMWLK